MRKSEFNKFKQVIASKVKSGKYGECDTLTERGNNMLKRNIIQCLKCNDIIESKYGHDFKQCKCGSVFIDGGPESPRFGYKRDEGDTVDNSAKYIRHLTDEEGEGNVS